MSLAISGCQYTYNIVGDQHYKCHREVVGGSIYCKTHAVEYEIPQHAAEPISGVFVETASNVMPVIGIDLREDKPKSDYEKLLDHIEDRGGLQEPKQDFFSAGLARLLWQKIKETGRH